MGTCCKAALRLGRRWACPQGVKPQIESCLLFDHLAKCLKSLGNLDKAFFPYKPSKMFLDNVLSAQRAFLLQVLPWMHLGMVGGKGASKKHPEKGIRLLLLSR